LWNINDPNINLVKDTMEFAAYIVFSGDKIIEEIKTVNVEFIKKTFRYRKDDIDHLVHIKNVKRAITCYTDIVNKIKFAILEIDTDTL